MTSTDEDGMGFYIGPHKKGFKAEITNDNEKIEKNFRLFSRAVEWVEREQQKMRKKDEIERSKEDA